MCMWVRVMRRSVVGASHVQDKVRGAGSGFSVYDAPTSGLGQGLGFRAQGLELRGKYG